MPDTTWHHPLEGANIFVIDEADESCGVDVVKATVAALGGRLCGRLEDATHAMWVFSSGSSGQDEQHSTMRPPQGKALESLSRCQVLNVPVVEPSWLERMSGLSPEEHWSEVDVGSHVPAVVADVAAPRIERQSTRRDDSISLDKSLAETWQFMMRENPQGVEEEELRRALELSLLDCALVVGSRHRHMKKSVETAWEILGVREGASMAEIKKAYKIKAKTAHPDKGGSSGEFARLAVAYRSLLVPLEDSSSDRTLRIKSTADRDAELRDHRGLVEALFENPDARQGAVERQLGALEKLGLRCVESGASLHIGRKGAPMENCCFYLSLATAYLSGVGFLADELRSPDPHQPTSDDLLRNETALRLKRLIESSVLAAHPEWASTGKVGDDVQAFSDFLVFVLSSDTMLADLAVAVFDNVSGFVDIYKGKNYDAALDQQANLLTLRFVPGHYQSLIPRPHTRPTLDELLLCLDAAHVLYVVTEG